MSIPYPVVVAAAMLLISGFVMTRTVLGLRLYAAGGDPRAAERAGVRVGRLVLGAYAVNGMLVGLAATLTTAQLGSGSPALGRGFELDVLTAVILGGVAFSGGAGRPLGVLIGVATIGILNAGLVFEGLQHWWQEIAKGAILLLALGADQISVARRERRVSRGATAPRLVMGGEEEAEELVFGDDEGDASNGRVVDRDRSGVPVLDVEGVSKRYGAVQALASGSIALHAGEVVGLLGDNGAGKSTLVKIIAGAVSPDAGEIRMAGRAVEFHDPADARNAGIETVYQDLALCPNLSVVHNLMLGNEPTRRWFGVLPVRDDRTAEVDARRRLAALSIRLPDASVLVEGLSGGQRQAIAVARAMDDHVRVVCLDEPTAALGVAQTNNVLRLVRSVAGRGTSVVMITHDVASVMKVCDRVVVLRQGRVIADGATGDMSELELLGLMAGIETSSARPVDAEVGS
jgi:ABC-type branched-subunit amino acid transport system ATPase component